jgi:hypothetical protein
MSFSRNFRVLNFDLGLFHDKRIIRSLKRIEELRNLKPLFMIWDDFVAYKSLEDDVFIEDFSKEIFVVTRTVLSSLDEHGTSVTQGMWLQELTQTAPNKTEFLLDAIDEITHALQKMVPYQPQNLTTTTKNAPPLDLKSEVSTDEIALRFYYIQRLHKAMDVLGKADTMEPYHTLKFTNNWKSVRIYALLRAMQESGTSQAVFNVWDEVKEYKFIDNLKFVREFASVVFLALRHLYPGSSASGIIGNTQANLENVDIETILHAIDIITDQLATTSNTYNAYSAESLQDWLQHYWWVPPMTIGTIILRIAYYYYVHHKPLGYGYTHHYPAINYATPQSLSLSFGKPDTLSF